MIMFKFLLNLAPLNDQTPWKWLFESRNMSEAQCVSLVGLLHIVILIKMEEEMS